MKWESRIRIRCFWKKGFIRGVQGKLYPYPTTEKISHEKKDKVWHAVYLENEYLKIMVLPELGGRIQRAYDKTNDYDFVYYNHVIKPALVGLAGPWISGGIEFNWPQHHRPTTYMPVDHQICEHEDGTKTLLRQRRRSDVWDKSNRFVYPLSGKSVY